MLLDRKKRRNGNIGGQKRGTSVTEHKSVIENENSKAEEAGGGSQERVLERKRL